MTNSPSLTDGAGTSTRRVAWTLCLLGTLVLAACGGTAAPSNAPAQKPTPLTTSTPGPFSIQATLTGDARITGPLNTGGVTHFVTCDAPSLSGETIDFFESTADPVVGAFVTVRAGSINVRLASGSGATYTERDFDGSGVTSFGAASGAQFSTSLTDATPAGGNKGTIETISSISGSVSCGTFTPGSGTITVTGDTGNGMLSGPLTSIRVGCGNSGGQYATVMGLSHVGSTPALIELAGGTRSSPFFVAVMTASGTQDFTNPATGLVTFPAGGVAYNATVTEQTASGSAGTHTLMASGTATCGS